MKRFLGFLWLAFGCSMSTENSDAAGTDAAAVGGTATGGSAAAHSGGAPDATGGAASGGAPATGGLGSGGEPGELPYLLGADITITLEDEYWGATYTDEGVEKPLEEILADHGMNAARIDTFVDPSAPGGYAEDKEQPFRSLDHTVTLARRVRAAGLHFFLDLHMSDTWTNPGAQAMPSAWVGLGADELEDAVAEYVGHAVGTLIDEGVRPDLVQIGNEITNGFLWEAGRIVDDDFTSFARLLKAGIAAVRALDPSIAIVLHVERCHSLEASRWWLDGVLEQGVAFDVLGQSCYAAAILDGEPHHPGYQGTPAEWAATFQGLAEEYPELRFLVAEYSAEPRAVNDVLRALPDGRGLGSFNWDPTRFYETHPNVPLFETNGAWNDYVTVPDRIAVYDAMASDYDLE